MERVLYDGRTWLIKYGFLIGTGGLMFITGVQLINPPGAGETGYVFALPGLLLLGQRRSASA